MEYVGHDAAMRQVRERQSALLGELEMRAIVTGGTGFIGSHVVDMLCGQGHSVGVIDISPPAKEWSVPSGVTLNLIDVASTEAEDVIADFSPDVIFHLAAKASVPASLADPVEDARTTLLGLLHVLEGARRGGSRKVVYSSSAAIYGDPHVAMPIGETLPLAPLSPYGAAKAAGETYLEVYRLLYGLHYASLRYANVYGPRQGLTGEGGVVAIFADKYARKIPLTLFGDGLHTRDYIYVEDVARANLLAAAFEGSISCHVSTGVETSNLELIAALEMVSGVTVPVLSESERAGDIRRSVLNPELAESELGFRAEIALSDGLSRTYRWMRERFSG